MIGQAGTTIVVPMVKFVGIRIKFFNDITTILKSQYPGIYRDCRKSPKMAILAISNSVRVNSFVPRLFCPLLFKDFFHCTSE
jgi:hypothetical protein